MDEKIDNSSRRRSRHVTKPSIKTKIKRNKTAMFLAIFIVLILVLGSIYVVFSNFKNNNENGIISDEERLIGIWKYSEYYEGQTIIGIFTFLSDKTCEFSASSDSNEQTLSGTWNITGNKLILNLEGTQTETTDYEFSNNNKTLTLTDDVGKTRVLIKQ